MRKINKAKKLLKVRKFNQVLKNIVFMGDVNLNDYNNKLYRQAKAYKELLITLEDLIYNRAFGYGDKNVDIYGINGKVSIDMTAFKYRKICEKILKEFKLNSYKFERIFSDIYLADPSVVITEDYQYNNPIPPTSLVMEIFKK